MNRVLALRSGDAWFKTCSADHSLNLFNFLPALVNSQLVCQVGSLTVVIECLFCRDCVSLAHRDFSVKRPYGEWSIKCVFIHSFLGSTLAIVFEGRQTEENYCLLVF